MLDTMDYIRNVLQALKPGNYNGLTVNQLLRLYDDFMKGV